MNNEETIQPTANVALNPTNTAANLPSIEPWEKNFVDSYNNIRNKNDWSYWRKFGSDLYEKNRYGNKKLFSLGGNIAHEANRFGHRTADETYNNIINKLNKYFEYDTKNNLNFSENSDLYLDMETQGNKPLKNLYHYLKNKMFNADEKEYLNDRIKQLTLLNEQANKYANERGEEAKINSARAKEHYDIEFKKLNDWITNKLAHTNKYSNEFEAAKKLGITSPHYLLNNPGLFTSSFAGQATNANANVDKNDEEEKRKDRLLKMFLGIITGVIGAGFLSKNITKKIKR